MNYPPRTISDDSVQLPTMLVVGDIDAWVKSGRTIPNVDGFHFTCFADLNAALMAKIQPDVILASLVSNQFDAIELGLSLIELGFQGRFRAITNHLPRPDVVKREIQLNLPGIDFDLMVLGPEGVLP